MDTSATLMGLGLLMAFIAPIGYLVIDQSRREKARKKKLFTAAAGLNLQISETYIVNGLSLGLDQQQRKLLVLESSNSYEPKMINLDRLKV